MYCFSKEKHFTNHDLIDRLSNAMGDPESELLFTKYYQQNEMAALFKNTNKHFSFFHLNISHFHFTLRNSQHLSLNKT